MPPSTVPPSEAIVAVTVGLVSRTTTGFGATDAVVVVAAGGAGTSKPTSSGSWSLERNGFGA